MHYIWRENIIKIHKENKLKIFEVHGLPKINTHISLLTCIHWTDVIWQTKASLIHTSNSNHIGTKGFVPCSPNIYMWFKYERYEVHGPPKINSHISLLTCIHWTDVIWQTKASLIHKSNGSHIRTKGFC